MDYKLSQLVLFTYRILCELNLGIRGYRTVYNAIKYIFADTAHFRPIKMLECHLNYALCDSLHAISPLGTYCMRGSMSITGISGFDTIIRSRILIIHI